MAATVQSEALTPFGATGTWVCTAPSGIQSGDLIVARLRNGGRSFNTPVDWTAGPTSGGASPVVSVFWKIAGASEPSTYTFVESSGALGGQALISRIAGAHATAPIDASAFSLPANNTASPWVAPAVSPTTHDFLLLVDFAYVVVATGQTFTPPGSMTQEWNFNTGTSEKSAGFSEQVSASGATGTRSVAISNTALTSAIAFTTLAIRADTDTTPILQTGETKADFASQTSWVANKPTGVGVGDLLLVTINCGVNATGWSPPAGWTAGPTQSAGSPFIVTFWRIADGTEGASFTFTNGSARSGGIVCQRITGAHLTSPIDVSSVAFVASGGGNPVSLPGVTTTGACRLLLALYCGQRVSALTFTTPTGMAAGYAYTVAGNQDVAFTQPFATANATGVRDSDSSATTIARSAILFAIAPGSTAPPASPIPRAPITALQAAQRAAVM